MHVPDTTLKQSLVIWLSWWTWHWLLTKVTIRLMAHVLVCTHVGTVHVNLAGCQRCGENDTCVWGHTGTYAHLRAAYPSALSPSHTPLMFQGVKKMEKRLQPNHFRRFQRFLFMCVQSQSEWRSLPQLRRGGRTLSVTRPRWKSYCVKGSK